MNLVSRFFRFLPLFMIFSLLLMSQGVAQNDEATERYIKDFLRRFAADYSNFPKTQDKHAVLSYFSPKATSNIFVFSISGKAEVLNSDIAGFSTFMDNVIRSGGYTIKYDVTDILDVSVTGPIATVAYMVDYEVKEEGGIWAKGKETVTMALRKVDTKWKIIHYTFMQVEDEQLRGSCVCELFTSDGSGIIGKTTIPNGKGVSSEMDIYTFPVTGREQFVKVRGNTYKRKSSGVLVWQINDYEEEELGMANTKKEMIELIITKHLYKDNCTNLKFKAP